MTLQKKILCVLCALGGHHLFAAQSPNVLFIAIDDLNDWVGCLGGHPQAVTPHIDRQKGRRYLQQARPSVARQPYP